MTLFTPEIRQQLIANGKSNPYPAADHVLNVPPVCWVYDTCSRSKFLLTEIDRNNPDLAWGLVDAGDGQPTYESVSIHEMEECHQRLPLPDTDIFVGMCRIENWKAAHPISAYIAAATEAGRIVEPENAREAA